MNSPPDGTRKQPDDPRPVPPLRAGDPVPGLSSWLLERKLGGGGFGAVWLARHALNKYAPRAVKFCTDPDARHRLVTHEKNVVARVMQHAGEHPNIVPLLEYNLDGAVPWLMYEYVEGGTLAALAEEWQALPLPKRLGRAVKVLHQIAGALAAMHRLNPPIVHRDLKPANILMAGAVPRITDFGIGSVALPEVRSDTTGAFTAGAAKLPSDLLSSGTPLYSSPEQRFGAQPGPRDDVFALGVIAYQFVSGDRSGQPSTDALAELRDLKVPTELASLIVRSTAFKPERRPKDAGEWETALGALLARFRSQPDASAASAPVLIAESGSLPGLVPATVPPPLPTRVLNKPEVHTVRVGESDQEVPEEALKRRRGLIALFLAACATLAVALFFALRDSKPEVAKQQKDQQQETQGPKPKAKGSFPKVVPQPNVATFPTNPKAGDEYDIEIARDTKMRFCYIPAGGCQLGSPKSERDKVTYDTTSEAEELRGKFRTNGFWMGKYEVTQVEWAVVMRGTGLETPSEFRVDGPQKNTLKSITDTGRFPVEMVSWDDCQEFLQRLTAYRGEQGSKEGFDLPHEDEWEYACRGSQNSERLDSKRPFYFGDSLNGIQANCDGRFPFGTTKQGLFCKRPQRVGSYEQFALHPWGLCDMHGNVWEWCNNTFDKTSTSRVVRGGSWFFYAHNCRTAFRGKVEPATRDGYCGFRVLTKRD